MSEVQALETASYATWTPDVSEIVAGWHVTATDGLSRRVNSARAIGEAAVDDDSRNLLERWFSSRNLPLVVRETPLMSEGTSRAVRNLWQFKAIDETLVMSNRSRKVPARGVRTVSIRNGTFQAELAALNGCSKADAETLKRLYARVSKKGVGVWIPGRAVAVVVRYRDAAGVFSVAVAEEHKQAGLGRRIMDAASTWASNKGIRDTFVQVLRTNEPAVELYRHLGFTERYRYRYLQPDRSGMDTTLNGDQ